MDIPVIGNEVGSWVAHKKNASLVHFMSAPFVFPWIATSVGTPINPSYMPMPFFPFGQKMSFKVGLKIIKICGLILSDFFYP